MKNNFNDLRKNIETLNITNNHQYRDLVNYLDLMAPYAETPNINDYQELKKQFTSRFQELGLYSDHKSLLELL